jgi:hypothetical protein
VELRIEVGAAAASTVPSADVDEAPGDEASLDDGEAGSAQPIGLAAPPGVRTELGGVLFLINVMQRLDLPACFEADWRLSSLAGAWGVLELLGRSLLAGRVEVLADPLWTSLAEIDGRVAGQPPGAEVEGPGIVHIPAAWLPWIGDDLSTDYATDLTDYEPDNAGGGVGRWVAAVAPLIRRMLQRMLGKEDIVTALLLRSGRLYVTRTHVDLVMPLAGVSLAVRRAGLDFDPGWLPAFGRVVKFHYE